LTGAARKRFGSCWFNWRAIVEPGGPSRILFSGTPSWEVVSADDLRIGARFVLGGARTLHAALRDTAQTIDRVCTPLS